MAVSPMQLKVKPSPAPPAPYAGPVVLAMGFRFFFLLAGGWAVIAMGVWLLLLEGFWTSASYLPAVWLHGHEMIFGFLAAAAAGFLLTAVPGWTEQPKLRGWPLAGLALVWLAGRGVMSGVVVDSPMVMALVDLAFLPLLTLAIALPVWRSGAHHQWTFPLLMALLWLGNLLFHLEALERVREMGMMGLYLGVDAMVMVMVAFGGKM
ncbi:MAG: NnrS family protein, partial [Magnetococcales bacterium]|nr:NnrS family protein [Magnetococcales bacterium]